MKFWVGVTDTQWYRYLRDNKPEDVNFWQPGANQHEFRAIEKGSPFLFKLKAPYNAIGGLGFFSAQVLLPLSVAWDFFGERNGGSSYSAFKILIGKYRNISPGEAIDNKIIGCLILTNPVFFDDADWIPAPENWANSIVQGKTYSDEEPIGSQIWQAVQDRLSRVCFFDEQKEKPNQLALDYDPENASRYRENVLSRVRIGQGAFRVMVAEAYGRRCAITGEHTLPVLEAAHIKPFAESGPHLISNGLLLRADLHKLFDSGYITFTTDYRMEVSPLIREEFNNGKIYYKLEGSRLALPQSARDYPKREFLIWHNEKVYKAG